MKLSVVLATKNEESNIGPCLESIKAIANEIIIYDEYSTDKTRVIAKRYGSRVFKYRNKSNFHKTKQHAINKATGDWILQLDADERVTAKLADEISLVIKTSNENLLLKVLNHSEHLPHQPGSSLRHSERNEGSPDKNKLKLFIRHQLLIEKREGKLGKRTGEAVAFFIPRLNYFLGKPLRYAGVYPDGVIRLFRRGRARLPGKSVHELMEADGEVGWLMNDLEHHESPTFSRYLERANRYTDLTAKEFERKKVPVDTNNLMYYSFIKPFIFFISLYFRHLGFLDGMRGFVWSAFSALHFPIAYFKYWQSVKK
jgi:glycosyltransferase involved in cell wall biosynthesis